MRSHDYSILCRFCQCLVKITEKLLVYQSNQCILFHQEPCHKGMKCHDHKCSCKHLEERLFEPHGGFCVLPRTTHFGIDFIDSTGRHDDSSKGPEVIVVGLLGAILGVGLVAIAIYVISARRDDIDLCAKGDYIVDADSNPPGNRRNQPHVAAWDAPGMDFLSEEQTMKYLNRTAGDNGSTSVTKSPSVATTAELVDEVAPSPSGSLPECEQGAARGARNVAESNYDNPVFSGNGKSGASSSCANSANNGCDSNSSGDEDHHKVTKSSNIL